jgi:hypothetical protein
LAKLPTGSLMLYGWSRPRNVTLRIPSGVNVYTLQGAIPTLSE